MIRKLYMVASYGAYILASVYLWQSGYSLIASAAPMAYSFAFTLVVVLKGRTSDLFCLKAAFWSMMTSGWVWLLTSESDHANFQYMFPLTAIVWWICLSKNQSSLEESGQTAPEPEHVATITPDSGGRPIPVNDVRIKSIAEEITQLRKSRQLSRRDLADLIRRDVDRIGIYYISDQLIEDVEESRSDYHTAAMLLTLSRSI